MNTIIEEKLNRLAELAETAQNKKILIEEMRLVSAKAFELQDELMALLDAQELVEKEFDAVQELFDVREAVWDIVNKIALRELDVKEKSLSKDTYKTMKEDAHQEHHCCGNHAHENECCKKHTHEGKCCGEKKKGECCCHKTEIN